MTKREELIKELTEMGYNSIPQSYIGKLADWVIADRARIVAPLVKYRSKKYGCSDKGIMDSIKHNTKAIDQALKLAGVDHD